MLDNRTTDLSGWNTDALADMLINGTELELKILIKESRSPLEEEIERDDRSRQSECPACGHIF